MITIFLTAYIVSPQRKIFKFGVIFLIFEILMHSILMLLFSFLIHMKLDSSIFTEYTWETTFIPLYLIFTISLLIIVFFVPGFLSKKLKLYRQLFLLLMYYAGFLVFCIYFPTYLDENNTQSILDLFNLLFMMFLIHGTSIIGSFVTKHI